eukprot:2681357-Lingulodinium_polyedra.AAC.1
MHRAGVVAPARVLPSWGRALQLVNMPRLADHVPLFARLVSPTLLYEGKVGMAWDHDALCACLLRGHSRPEFLTS